MYGCLEETVVNEYKNLCQKESKHRSKFGLSPNINKTTQNFCNNTPHFPLHSHLPTHLNIEWDVQIDAACAVTVHQR